MQSPEASEPGTGTADEQLRHVLAGTRDGIWDWNIQTGEVLFDQNWARMLGYRLDEVEPHVSSWERLVHPDDLPRAMATLTAHLEGITEHYSCEHRLLAKSGEWIWVLDRGRVIERDASGAPLRAAGSHLDITRRKQAEVALEESEARYRGLVESQRDLIVRVDTQGRFSFVNDAYCAMFGKTRQELIGNSFTPLVHPDDLPATLAAMKDLMSPPHRILVDQRALTAIGWRWLSWEDDAITDSNGSIVEIQAIGRDVTERKLIEDQLIAQRDLTQRVSETRSLTETLGACLDVAIRLGQMDCGGVYLTDPQTGQLQFVASRGLPHSIDAWARSWGRGAAHAGFVEQCTPCYLSQIPDHIVQHQTVIAENVRSLAVLPIVEKGRAIGAMLLASRIWDEVPELARPTLETLLLQTSMLVRRSRDEETARLTQRGLEDRLRETNRTLNERLGELKQYAYEARLLSEMASLLQVCLQADEAYRVVERQLALLFPAEYGVLYVVSGEGRDLLQVARWGASALQTGSFATSDCWGMRRGRGHLAVEGTLDLRCSHIGPEAAETSLCVPLIAQGETLGLLHIRSELADFSPAKQDVAQMVADKIALALSNVSLRDSLREQSIRDPLTGLFNRRYLHESLRQQLARCARSRMPLGLILLDIDHFKTLNDTHGHDAGDLALREVAAALSSCVREGDVVCRYGGEEFLIVLSDAGSDATLRQAQRVLSAVRNLSVSAGSRSLGPISVSAGVAIAPEHGVQVEHLLRAADEALYEAKGSGRDRVCVASSPRSSGSGRDSSPAQAA